MQDLPSSMVVMNYLVDQKKFTSSTTLNQELKKTSKEQDKCKAKDGNVGREKEAIEKPKVDEPMVVLRHFIYNGTIRLKIALRMRN